MMRNRLVRILPVSIALSMTVLTAQNSGSGTQHGRNTLTIEQSESPIVLDGRFDEPVWQRAEAITRFIQRDPDQGSPASQDTQVQVAFDQQNLYVGVRCFDTDPAQIRATELRRDDSFDNDDSFAIILDTFHDHRNSFLFRINPRGTQYDALVTDEGRDLNVSWDEVWEAETQITEEGWFAEIRIPLKSIRFASTGGDTAFGADFERVLRRRNESSYWNNYSRDFDFEQVSQAGHLTGMGTETRSLRLRIKPYVGGKILTRGSTDRDSSFLGAVGLEDLKYSVTSGLTLDATINTDFAQTEVDDQVINFDRFPVFFPEKREFFLEGAGIFEFGSWRGEGRPQVKLYHSRQIGLSERGEEIPMLGGVKLTGKLGEKFTLGFLEAQTDDFQDRPGDNFAVFRLKRDLLERSSLGFFFTNRQAENGDFNRVVGVDENLILYEHLSVTGMLGRSFTDGVEDNQLIAAISGSWKDDFWDTGFTYLIVDDNFESDLGFLERQGTRKLEPRIAISPRPQSDSIRQLLFSYRMEEFERTDNHELETRIHHFNHSIFFQNGSWIRFAPHHETENLVEELRLPGGLRIESGLYSWWYFPITYQLNPARRISGALGYRYEKDYYGKGGSRSLWQIQPVVKFSSRVSAEIDYNLNQIKLANGEEGTFHQVNNRINIAFSRKWLTSTRVQYNSASDLIGVNFRLNYIYRPGDDFFFVYNDFRDRRLDPSGLDRSLVFKFTHSFEF